MFCIDIIGTISASAGRVVYCGVIHFLKRKANGKDGTG